MRTSDKNRKILWARSGNRCAICRRELVVPKTEMDSESVVGDECHIISGAINGPRYDPHYPTSDIDYPSNLILLCRVHHKMVDDQVETYTADVLRAIKSNHEAWVEARLREEPPLLPIRVKRLESEIPQHLPLVQSGKELLDLALGCHGGYHDYGEGLDDEEVELVGNFIQNVSDWVDIGDLLEPIERIRAAKALDGDIAALKSSGFMVFAARERQRLEGGVNPPSSFFVLHLSVRRIDDPNVVTR